jgi:hypothetical protein
MRRVREIAGWFALSGGVLWVASTFGVRAYYPDLAMPKALAFTWILGAASTIIGSALAIPKWQSVFGLLVTLLVFWGMSFA